MLWLSIATFVVYAYITSRMVKHVWLVLVLWAIFLVAALVIAMAAPWAHIGVHREDL